MVFIHGMTAHQQVNMSNQLAARHCGYTIKGDGVLVESYDMVSDIIKSEEFKGVKIDLNPAIRDWGRGAFPVNDYSARSKNGSLGRP